MAGDLLHEEGHFAGQVLHLRVSFRQRAHVGRGLVILLDGGDSLGGEFLVRVDVAEHRGRVAVAREGLHLEAGVDQRVGAGEGIPLGAREQRVLADGDRQSSQRVIKKASGLLLRRQGNVLPPVHGARLPDQKPAVQPRQAALLPEQLFCHVEDPGRIDGDRVHGHTLLNRLRRKRGGLCPDDLKALGL